MSYLFLICFFRFKKNKQIIINGSGRSPAGDPRHDPFKQDKRVDPFTVNPNPLILCRVRVGFMDRVKIAGPTYVRVVPKFLYVGEVVSEFNSINALSLSSSFT